MKEFILKSEHLAAFYELMPAKNQDNFREKTCAVCGWTYSKWRNKLKGRTPINILESDAIKNLLVNESIVKQVISEDLKKLFELAK